MTSRLILMKALFAVCCFLSSVSYASKTDTVSRILPQSGLSVSYSNEWREVGVAESMRLKAVELFLTDSRDARHKRMIVGRLTSGKAPVSTCSEEKALAEQSGKKVTVLTAPRGWSCVYKFIGNSNESQFFAHRTVARSTIKSQKFWSAVDVTEFSGNSVERFQDWLSSMKEVAR